MDVGSMLSFTVAGMELDADDTTGAVEYSFNCKIMHGILVNWLLKLFIYKDRS
jgi:hypothetical protein